MKERIGAITAMRGLGVLGVIGIHTGSVYIENPSANLILLALYDEASRYAVPIFFFLSAFGLFYKLDLNAKFDYFSMLRRRLKAVLIPYITWSALYLCHTAHYFSASYPKENLFEIFFFGLAKYHIYFLVLLIWFYLLMPLWIYIVKRLTKPGLIILLALQIALNYFFSYSGELYLFQTSLEKGSFLQLALMHRLNYWVVFYAFIFLFGAYLSQRFDDFKLFLRDNKVLLTGFFVVALTAQLAHFFILINMGRSPLEAVYTAHQLSPVGVIYTIAACVFFFRLFTFTFNVGVFYESVSFLGKHSYFIYLAHPLFLTMVTMEIYARGIVVTAVYSIAIYVFVLLCSLFGAVLVQKISAKIPLIGVLIIGKK